MLTDAQRAEGWRWNLWCPIFHRKHWSFYGHGDWRIQCCSKCGDKWVVPFYVAHGPRIEPPSGIIAYREEPRA